ncbi:PqqD family peptide modification chaperone [bacterium]|nr:PqqD family peptide modification chaperone [bacterium]
MSAQAPNTLDRILLSLKLKKNGPALTREQAMQAWPVRNPALQVSEREEGLVTIELPRRKDWMGGVLGFLFSVPQSKPVQLDEVGSFVWGLCDGDHTVSDIVGELVNEYKLNRREVEVSLTQYLQTLAKRGMVGFAVPREVAEAAGLAGEEITPEAEPEESAAVAAETVSEFHPELPAEEPAAGDDTSDMAPVAAEGPEETPVAEPAADDIASPSEKPDDQEHPGGL